MKSVGKLSLFLSFAARHVLLMAAIILLVFTASACKKRERAASVERDDRTSFNAQPGSVAFERAAESKPETAEKTSALQKRKIILSHDLVLEVKSLSAAFQATIDLTKAGGGYTIETGRVRNEDGSYLGRVVMRVPPGKAGGLLEKLRAFGTVTSENSTGEDITDEYFDMDARLKNLRASEARLLGLMTRQTQKLADVLAVERELTRVRGDIESLEAQKRNWDVLTALVTIRVELVEPKGAFPVLYRVWNPIRTAFGEALEGFSESFHALIVFVGTILPWAILFGLPLYLYFKFRRKKRLAAKAMN